jgi:proteasome accessory factor B
VTDRAERLLDLISLLLDAKAPLSWADIRAALPGLYAGSPEATQRKFERDKAELLELGLPLRWVDRTDEVEAGYVLDRDAYYLPDLDLTPEELAVLYAAGSAALASGAFPGRADLSRALQKVSYLAGSPLPAARLRIALGSQTDASALASHLELLWQAVTHRRAIDLEYYSPHGGEVTRRRVDPYGLALRRGAWCLVGHCHLRGATRTFFVHRIRACALAPPRGRGPDFDLPAGFELDRHVATWPWQHHLHPPLMVTVRLTAELAPLAEQLFPGPIEREGDAATVTLEVSDLESCLAYVASLGPAAAVVSPDRAVQRHRERLEAVLTAHGGAS